MTHSHPAEATFRVAYVAAHNDVLRFIQRRVDVSHAEDIAAEVFLVAWRRFDELPESLDEQRAWLFGGARKTLANSPRWRNVSPTRFSREGGRSGSWA